MTTYYFWISRGRFKGFEMALLRRNAESCSQSDRYFSAGSSRYVGYNRDSRKRDRLPVDDLAS